ncbi:15231_t:CDS:2 [Gigaspora margarita]|uniref:15231_t:CDS:1 n=1 Tax=Gigaspora margarita TaxID=4874 RepID=A0ABM8W6D7_GIGMA|nr:15231_t:CDS:2 [Gigaspora margarita]
MKINFIFERTIEKSEETIMEIIDNIDTFSINNRIIYNELLIKFLLKLQAINMKPSCNLSCSFTPDSEHLILTNVSVSVDPTREHVIYGYFYCSLKTKKKNGHKY